MLDGGGSMVTSIQSTKSAAQVQLTGGQSILVQLHRDLIKLTLIDNFTSFKKYNYYATIHEGYRSTHR